MRLLLSLGLALGLAGCEVLPPPAPPSLPPGLPLGKAEPGIPPHVHLEDVIYGRKYGTALTLDVLQPLRPNGAAILGLDTGGWVDDHDHIWAGSYTPYLERGYTIFHVVHGSSPKFSVPEQIADVRRAVKFVRAHAAEYGVDPGRIGITGGSTGGLLALMMGVTDTADPAAKDPVERVSSRVSAVGVFAPVTSLTHVGWPWPGQGDRAAEWPLGAFLFLDFMEKPRDRVMLSKGVAPGTSPGVVRVLADPDKGMAILRASSPIEQVTPAAAPTMIIQGSADKVVPLERTQRFVDRLRAAGVPVKLVVEPGVGHGLPDEGARRVDLADWFDRVLSPRGR
jgi:acetyl esterase/lipase